MIVNNIVKVGGQNKCVRGIIQGGGSGSIYFWDGDVDDEPPQGPVNWGVSTQVSHMNHCEAAPSVSGRNLVVPTFGDDDAGGGV